MNKIFVLIFLFVYSCSFLIPQENLGIESNVNNLSKVKNYCSGSSDFELIDSGPYLQTSFKEMLRKTSFLELSSVDKFIIWSFFQMNARPDSSSPTSKLIGVYEYNGAVRYIDVAPGPKIEYPTLQALQQIIEDTRNKRNIYQLASIYDQYAPQNLKINQKFSNFISKNKENVLNNKDIKKVFARGEEILREGETVPKISFAKFLRHKKFIQNYKNQRQLFEYVPNKKFTISCNYDFKLYDSTIYLINENHIESNIFGLRDRKFKILVSTFQEIKNFELIPNSFFVKGNAKTQSPALCMYSQNEKDIWLISDQSRDPGQHLYHLMNYGLNSVETKEQLNKFLGFSRHLILRNPLRLIFESKRGSPEQLEQLLKLNIPTYNADNLGNVWLFFQNKNDQSFFYDPRNSGEISCEMK